jgi:hypothetical protein
MFNFLYLEDRRRMSDIQAIWIMNNRSIDQLKQRKL